MLSLMLGAGPVRAVDVAAYPALGELVEVMVGEDGYPRAELEAVLAAAVVDEGVVRAMDRQYEAKPWYAYRKLFINEARISKGVVWWQQHRATLARAEEVYGVPAAVVVALLGIETHYGTRLGGKRVLDSLVTLTADYPRRSAFFGRELRAFLNTARAEGIAPDSVLGSFAGAVGIPQFMPSSYQAYAVDFNGNGRRDLVNDTEDAIGSVANYLSRHGWQRGQTIVVEAASPLPDAAEVMVTRRAKPKLSAAQLQAAGVDFNPQGGSDAMALLRLQARAGPRHVVGFANLYAITRYNPSVNYAMAVVELSRELSERSAL